ncbi:MAG: hypothetical protein ACK4Q5_08390 [Saprospiraceae bacterium]
MSKKRLIEGDVFSAMTNAAPPAPAVQAAFRTAPVPQPEPMAARKSTEVGLPPGLTRATIIAEKDLIEKCRDIAYWERLRDQDVYSAALSAYIEQYEKRIGRSVDARPEHARRVVTRGKSLV